MKEYNTEQKRSITDFLKIHGDRHFTVEEITDAVCTDGRGKSTVYRQISKLLDAGTIRRFEALGSKNFVYQFADVHADCDSHYHLKCIKCGRLIHLKCDRLDEVRDHIKAEHNFIIGSGKAVLYGECAECAECAEAEEEKE